MSVYATIRTHNYEPEHEDTDWFISVAVWPVDEPIRINHGDDEWYLTQDDARKLLAALRAAVSTENKDE